METCWISFTLNIPKKNPHELTPNNVFDLHEPPDDNLIFPLSLIMLHWTWEQMTHQWVLCQTWWWLRQRQRSCQCWSYWQGRHCVHQSACSLVKMFRSKVWQQSLLMAKSFLATLWLKKSSTQQRTKEEKSSYCKNAEVSFCECAASFKIDWRYFVQQRIGEDFTLAKHWNSLENRLSSYVISGLASALWQISIT